MKKLFINYCWISIIATTAHIPTIHNSNAQNKPKNIKIFTTNYPINYIVNSLLEPELNSKAQIISPKKNQNTLNWIPKRKELSKIITADLIILNGLNYETWSNKVNLPTSKTLIIGDNFTKKILYLKKTITHNHNGKKEHTHKIPNPYIWSSPRNLIEINNLITKKIQNLLPKNKKIKIKNQQLKIKLQNIHKKLKHISQNLKNFPLYTTSKPHTYAYITNEYNLQIQHINKNQLQKIIDTNQKKIILYNDKNDLTHIQTTSQNKQFKLIHFSICQFKNKDQDYLETWETNLNNLQNAIK